MSEGNVAILNTKLDILIDDFKTFKSYAIGFVMTVLIPFAVYMVVQLANNTTDVAVVKAKMEVSDKAIKEEK